MHLTIDDKYASMPWDELDAIVFDVGNVLLSFSPEQVLLDEFPDDAPLRERMMVKVFRSPYWAMLDHGTMTYAEAEAAMTGRDEALRPAVHQVLCNWVDLKDVIEEGLAALHAAKAYGKKCFVLSNYHTEAFEVVRNKYDFFDLFDGMIVSAHIGLLKPDPAIYRYVTDTYGLEPSRTLFIDDTPSNVEAAMNVGWQGFCRNEDGRLARFIGA